MNDLEITTKTKEGLEEKMKELHHQNEVNKNKLKSKEEKLEQMKNDLGERNLRCRELDKIIDKLKWENKHLWEHQGVTVCDAHLWKLAKVTAEYGLAVECEDEDERRREGKRKIRLSNWM